MALVSYTGSSDEEESITDEEEDVVVKQQPFSVILPKPKQAKSGIILEEDDEFLKKKAVPEEKPPPQKARVPVKITFPSLSQFKNDEEEISTRKLTSNSELAKTGICGLLKILPAPTTENIYVDSFKKTSSNSLIPHSVMNKRKETQTLSQKQAVSKKPVSIVQGYESSDGEDGDDGDFFSLNKEEKLPEISKNEINLLVAKRAAKMTENYNKMTVQEPEHVPEVIETGPRNTDDNLDEEALQTLIGGSRAKRAKMNDFEFLELSHEQVMPDREEWKRTALANSTDPLPRGEIKDGPKGVAKRKHQITYLAHQAKSNEAELQAMWAANRQSKRQTQSKYGF